MSTPFSRTLAFARTLRATRESTPSTRQQPRLDQGDVAAVKIRSRLLGQDIWLVADQRALAENSDIVASGLPALLFEEVPYLHGLPAEQLRRVLYAKRVFPGGRMVQ